MKERIEKGISRVLTLVTVLCITLCLTVCAKAVLKKDLSVMGFRLFHVITGSMEPTIQTGSLVVVYETSFEELETGDIITFNSRDAYLNGAANTHRIVRFIQDEKGRDCIVTRGDANNAEDETYVYPEDLLGKVVYYSNMNEFTTFLSFVKSVPGFITVIVLPLMLVGWSILRSLRKELALAQAENAKRAEEEAEKPKEDPIMAAFAAANIENPTPEMIESVKAQLGALQDKKEEK